MANVVVVNALYCPSQLIIATNKKNNCEATSNNEQTLYNSDLVTALGLN